MDTCWEINALLNNNKEHTRQLNIKPQNRFLLRVVSTCVFNIILPEGTPCDESAFRGFLRVLNVDNRERMDVEDVRGYAKHGVLPLSGAERLGSLLGRVVSPI